MRNSIKNLPVLFFVVIFALAGCGGGGGNSSSDVNNPATISATAVIGLSGGNVNLSDGTVVTIDAGIVKDGTTVTITSEPAPASSSAEITPISSVVRITIPDDSFAQLSIFGSDGISVKIPINAGQQTVASAVAAAAIISNAYRYVKVKGKAAANTAADGWTAYAKFTLDAADTLAGLEVATVKILAYDNLVMQSFGLGVELYVESFIPTVATAGQLFEVQADGTFPLASTGIEIQDGKLPLVLVHGIQSGCDFNANAYKKTWEKFRENFYLDPSLSGKYELYTFSYQSDLSIQANGLKLATALKAAFNEQQAVVIAHSMGGLVTRSAMVHYAGIAARIGGVITLGTPHHGTVAVQKVAGVLDMFCLFAASPSSDGANDMAWDNFDNDAVCDNDFLCGSQGLNTMDTIANLEKYIPYAGVLGSDPVSCFGLTAFSMCLGNSAMGILGGGLWSQWDAADGLVPMVSARFTDFDDASGDYYDKYPWNAKPRTYSGIHHVSIHDDLSVFTQNPNGSDGGIAKDLLDFYSSLIPLAVNLKITAPIAGGHSHTIALKNDGTVWAWGGNYSGQLGDGTSEIRFTPVQVSGLTGVTAIAGGGSHTIALKNDGTVWTWGNTISNGSTPGQVSGLTDITSVSAGGFTSFALKNDGTAWAWGGNYNGQLGDRTKINRSTPVQVYGLTDITAIDAERYHTIALKNDGTVWAWGNNDQGQLGDGTKIEKTSPVQVSELTGVTAIAGGYKHTVALKNDGTVWAWGSDYDGQLGNAEWWLSDTSVPVQVGGLTNVIAIAGGFAHTIVLKDDGTVWAWGNNRNGQLGDGTTITRDAPVRVSGLTGVTAIAAGVGHIIALKSDGTVWAWGANYSGQLGDDTTINRYTPIQVSGFTGVTMP